MMDGITIGSGVSVVLNARYRCATPNTVISLPETRIGLVPDAGMTFVLSRLPRKIGHMLALTGHELKAADVL